MSLLNFFRKEQLSGGPARNKNTSGFKVDTEETNNITVGADTEQQITENQETEETYEILEREILPAKIICPDCGGITLEGLEFCDKCGGELQ